MITQRKKNTTQKSSISGKNCTEKNRSQEVLGSIQYFENSCEYNKFSEDLQVDTETLNELLGILREINSDLNLRNILDIFLNACIDFFKSDRGAILLQNDNNEYELKAARDNKNNNLLSFPISKTIIQMIIEKRNPLFFPDFLENEPVSSSQGSTETNRSSIMCAPLKNNTTTKSSHNYSTDSDELLGLIYLESRDSTGAIDFISINLKFFQILADQAAVAINNALYNERLKVSIEELEDRINLRTKELMDSNSQLNISGKKIQELQQELEKNVNDRSKKREDINKYVLNENHKDDFSNITAETLHNVKNILNSIKVSSEFAGKSLLGKAYKGFCQANEMLRKNIGCIEDFICNDPKGKKLMQYYLKLDELFREESKESIKHIDRLRESVDIISDIISAQQEYGKGSIPEDISLSKVIDDALTIQFGTLKNYKIKVIKNYTDLPTVSVQKTKFMHVLINLIKNAKESMIETPAENRILKFEYGENESRIQLKIIDTGCGISGENIKHLFSYGFTTKKDGNGYGLHSCQVYMKEMDGDITASSEGKGKGATFTIEFGRSAKK